MKKKRVVLFKTPIRTSLLLPLHTSERAVLIEINALSHPKWPGRGKVPFLRILPGTDPVETGGPVAQGIRARGYEPRCRGFESLLAHNRPKREVPFPLGVGKS